MNVEFTYNPHKYHPWRWYYSPQGAEFFDVVKWCNETYGQSVYSHRWELRRGWLTFADKKDAELFVLRWAT